jgi:hypothetical protein
MLHARSSLDCRWATLEPRHTSQLDYCRSLGRSYHFRQRLVYLVILGSPFESAATTHLSFIRNHHA